MDKGWSRNIDKWREWVISQVPADKKDVVAAYHAADERYSPLLNITLGDVIAGKVDQAAVGQAMAEQEAAWQAILNVVPSDVRDEYVSRQEAFVEASVTAGRDDVDDPEPGRNN